MKQDFGQHRRDGRIVISEKGSASQQAASKLKDLKEQSGKKILVAIDRKTTIELPESLTQAERDERVAMYIRLHHRPKI